MGNAKMGEIADQGWLRLLARGCMALFGAIGSIGIPMLVSFFASMATDQRLMLVAIGELRQEVRVAQARDEERFRDIVRRLEILERRDEDRRASRP